MRRFLIFLTIGALCVITGLNAAQEDSGIDCSHDAIMSELARLASLLADFDVQVQTDETEAFDTLKTVADGYQAIVTNCQSPDFEFDSTSIGDPDNGQRIFEANYVNQSSDLVFSCTSCHGISGSGSMLAPGFDNLINRIALRLDVLTPLEIMVFTDTPLNASLEDQITGYLYVAITHPATFSTGAYHKDIMPEDWGTLLSQQEVLDLVAYLLTLDD